MKIVQLMVARGHGGAQRHFVDLTIELAHRGHHVLAVCDPAAAVVGEIEACTGIRVAKIRARGSWDHWAAWRMRRAFDCFRPDVVHVHLARGAALGGRAARACGIPVVTNLHNFVKLRYYAAVDHFVAATPAQVDYLRARGLDSARIDHLPHFTRMAVTNCRRRATGAKPRFVAAGRYVDKKGFEFLLDAFARLRTRGCDAELMVVGDGPRRGALERRARALGIAGDVAFPGWTDTPQEQFDRADVFVLPSLDEPFGIVVLEAMARGLPIVATRTSGPATILDDTTAGLVRPGDSEALALMMADALEHPATTRSRALAARARLLRHYTPAAVMPRYLSLYEGLRGTPA